MDLSGGIFPLICLILTVSAPEVGISAGGRACFVPQGQNERLGVDWRFCLCLVLVWGFYIFLELDFI